MSYILFFNKPNTYPLHWPHPRRFWWCKYGPTLIRRGFLGLGSLLGFNSSLPEAISCVECYSLLCVWGRSAQKGYELETQEHAQRFKKKKKLHWQSQSDTITDSINQYIKFFKERKRDQNGRSRLKGKCNAKPRTNFFFSPSPSKWADWWRCSERGNRSMDAGPKWLIFTPALCENETAIGTIT